jgi:erythromycin esterase-like protein
LGPFIDQIGSARVVALGESSTGSKQLTDVKGRIVRRLAQQGNWTLVVDGPPFAGTVLDETVNGDAMSSKPVIRQVLRYMCHWYWRTEEAVSLVRALQADHQAMSGASVRVRAIDVQSPSTAISDLRLFAEMLYDVDRGARDFLLAKTQSLSLYVNKGQAGCEFLVLLRNESATQRNLVRETVQLISDTLVHNRSKMTGQSSGLTAERVDEAIRAARQLVLWAAVESGTMTRGAALAENVDSLLANDPTVDRLVIWGHNNQVSRRPGSMGEHLAASLGHSYLPVGFAVSDGSIASIQIDGETVDPSPSSVNLPKPPGAIGESYEGILRLAERENFVADLRAIPESARSWFAEERWLWDIDSRFDVRRPEMSARKTIISNAFDLFVWIRSSAQPSLFL